MLTVLGFAATAAVIGIIVVVALASRRPDTFSYERSTIIATPPEAIFPLIADLVAFNSWNPFNEDPSITGSYSGPPRGPGARNTFASKRAGTGHIEILEEHAPDRLVVGLVMTKPMACDNRVEFRLEPVEGGTRVTWAMAGPMTFMAKLMSQVMDCDKMCGNQFDKGLAALKRRSESQPVAA